MIGDIHYLNSGDWVESLTAIVEHFDGHFELIDFKQFTAKFQRTTAETDSAEIDEPLHLPVPVQIFTSSLASSQP